MEDVISERVLKVLRTIGDPILEDAGRAAAPESPDAPAQPRQGPGDERRAPQDVRAELAHVQEARERGLFAIAEGRPARTGAGPRRDTGGGGGVQGEAERGKRYIDGLSGEIWQSLASNGNAGTGPASSAERGHRPVGLVPAVDADDRQRQEHAADVRAFQTAQRLFGRYGTEISAALLLAALPQTYATRWGPNVLVATGGLVTDLRRRIQGTAGFLLRVMTPSGTADSCLDPPAVPWEDAARASVALRVLHHTIRTGLSPQGSEAARRLGLSPPGSGEGNDVPLNQEDLLGTLLTFTVTVFEVLERFGIAWTREEQEAYLRAWDKVGAVLGIGDATVIQKVRDASHAKEEEIVPAGWTTLRPPSVPAARAMMEAFRKRHWPEVVPWTGRGSPTTSPLSAEWESLRPGRLLTAALIDELTAAMSPRTRALPSTLIRILAPPVVRDRLALGGGGMVQALADMLPRRRVRLDGFTVVTQSSHVGAPALRQAANYVVRRTFVHFLENGGRFSLPGFTPEWASALRAGG
jgi:hypothetical protein